MTPLPALTLPRRRTRLLLLILCGVIVLLAFFLVFQNFQRPSWFSLRFGEVRSGDETLVELEAQTQELFAGDTGVENDLEALEQFLQTSL